MMATRQKELLFGLLAAGIACIVYVNTLSNGFVWDDTVVIVTNPALRGDALPLFSSIDVAHQGDLAPYYRPLTILTFLAEERLHGLLPLPMHGVNILLHAVNAFLVYRIVKLIGHGHAAVLAAVLFAVHPINAESVDFLSGGRNTLFACMFALVAFLLHQHSMAKGRLSLALAGSGAFLLALLSKETALAVFLLIVEIEIMHVHANGRGAVWQALARILPFAACLAIYLVLRTNALFNAGVHLDILTGLGSRILDNVYIIPRYFLSVIWPPAISSRYFLPDDLHLLALPIAGAWICIVTFMIWLLGKGRSRLSLFGLGWFIACWLPVSGIIPFPSAPLADRYLYLPAIGLWMVAADQFLRLVSADGNLTRYGLVIACLLVGVLTAFTIVRNFDWKDDVSLFTRYVQQSPDQAFGHLNLGCAYLEKVGDLDAAENEFETTKALDPCYPRLWTQLGYVHLLKEDYEGAVTRYNEALGQNPADAEALLNRALALDRLGKYADAVRDFRRFLATPHTELPNARPYAEQRVRELSHGE